MKTPSGDNRKSEEVKSAEEKKYMLMRGRKRRKFQHYKDFIALPGTCYDTNLLSSLLDPTSICRQTLR